jgi:hypothetical protein
LDSCLEILDITSCLIAEKFPEPGCDYVNERFEPRLESRPELEMAAGPRHRGPQSEDCLEPHPCANYYRAKDDQARADELFSVARSIGERMSRLGIDQVRSGVFDALERRPAAAPDIPVQFAWLNTKDFWQ